ncbi:MAG: hypothetical protein IT376_23385 [Polyangiaceae bacterium]|nr:hypothetical protein [Polyangiaceae bacterium]
MPPTRIVRGSTAASASLRRRAACVAGCLAATVGACQTSEEPAKQARPRPAPEFTLVELDPAAPAPLALAVQACAGLHNRASGGSVYVRREANDTEWLTELAIEPEATLGAAEFLAACASEFPSCVRYDYSAQQALLPPILTAAAALGAVPLDASLGVACGVVAFDAVSELSAHATPLLATRYVSDRYLAQTSGLAMLNPGYELEAPDLSNPAITRDMPAHLVDFVFSQRLFALFLVNGCEPGHPERELFGEIVNAGPWPTPVGVYGYNNSWLNGGYEHEAQTRCLDSRNLGAIPTETWNLSFFSTRRSPITAASELPQNPPGTAPYDPTKTYVAFVVGDGDNVAYILSSRKDWLRQRLEDCARPDNSCQPLTWSLSPHLPRIAPDVLEWYYRSSRATGNDFFVLPPSGHFYSYPSSLREEDQARFVTETERDARVLGVTGIVHWDFLGTWHDAEDRFLPRYATAGGAIRGIFPVNVPYMIEAFPWWPPEALHRVLTGADGTRLAVFRPREWRGVDDTNAVFLPSPQRLADELGAYPPGTVTWVYMTSDGGLTLENSFIQLVKLLPPHVQLVSADTAARLAIEASGG